MEEEPASCRAKRGAKLHRIAELQRRLARPAPINLKEKEAEALEKLTLHYVGEFEALQESVRNDHTAREERSYNRRVEKDRSIDERGRMLLQHVHAKQMRVQRRKDVALQAHNLASFQRAKSFYRVAEQASRQRFHNRCTLLEALSERNRQRSAQIEQHREKTAAQHDAMYATSQTLRRVDAARARRSREAVQQHAQLLLSMDQREYRVRARSPSPAAAPPPPPPHQQPQTPAPAPSLGVSKPAEPAASPTLSAASPKSVTFDDPSEVEPLAITQDVAVCEIPPTVLGTPSTGATSVSDGIPMPSTIQRPQSAPPGARRTPGSPMSAATDAASSKRSIVLPSAAGSRMAAEDAEKDYIAVIGAREVKRSEGPPKLAHKGVNKSGVAVTRPSTAGAARNPFEASRPATVEERTAELAGISCVASLSPGMRRDIGALRAADRTAHDQRRQEVKDLVAARRQLESQRRQRAYEEATRSRNARRKAERRKVEAVDQSRQARAEAALAAKRQKQLDVLATSGASGQSRQTAVDQRREEAVQAKADRQRMLDLAHLGIHMGAQTS
eukprot:TRINITY_DN27723_c0_g1_i1.p1 TRINITY_DN27723_c0_g1~~TRINITY_DN27723_c0_g1_i1.p1  ORF type:complete len:559 (+),score=128.85 TRINITY_DN27723_c0_g1_i1:60-1736(+)